MTKRRVHKVQGLRASGAAGVHGDRRSKRVRERGARKRDAIAREH